MKRIPISYAWALVVLAGCGNASDPGSAGVGVRESALSAQSPAAQPAAQPTTGPTAGAARTYHRSQKDPNARNRATGLRPPTAADKARDAAKALTVVDVKPTPLAVERLHQHVAEGQKKAGSTTAPDLAAVEAAAVPIGEDLVAAPAAGSSAGTVAPSTTSSTLGALAAGATLPRALDNSTLKAFPEIRDQGQIGSCVAFAVGYYQYTHELGLIYQWDNKNANNATKVSPKWVYNLANGQDNEGTTAGAVYGILRDYGALTWDAFPYVGDPTNPVNYREWPRGAATWERAMKYRALEWADLPAPTSAADIQTLKSVLLNGHVVTFSTAIWDWEYDLVDNDPATTADDGIAGQPIVTWVDSQLPNHQMTVVGYNDDIWVDLNGNGPAEPGEKGAFKVANSWGPGWYIYFPDTDTRVPTGGFIWVAYDALFDTTQVAGGPTGQNRLRAMWYPGTVKPRANYQPKLMAEFTLSSLTRSGMFSAIGLTEPDRTTPFTSFYPSLFGGNGGPYAFDGTIATQPQTASFALDLTDFALSYGDVKYQYTVTNYEQTRDTLSGLTLVDALKSNARIVTKDPTVSLNPGETKAQTVRYTFQDPTRVPQLRVTSSPSVAFGNVALGTGKSTALSVQNTGTGDAVISSLRFDNPLFFSATQLPLRVPPATAMQVDLQFGPASSQSETSGLSIRANSQTAVGSVALSGTGTSNDDAAPFQVYITQQNVPNDNSIAMRVELKSHAPMPARLSNYQVVYYFNDVTVDVTRLVWDTYYTTGPINVAFKKLYLAKPLGPRNANWGIQFTFSEGSTIYPNTSVIFQGSLHYADYSWYPNETDDWSRWLRRDGMAEGTVVQDVQSKNILFGVSPEAPRGAYSLAVTPNPVATDATVTFVVNDPTMLNSHMGANLELWNSKGGYEGVWYAAISSLGPQTVSIPMAWIAPGQYTLVLSMKGVALDAFDFTKL